MEAVSEFSLLQPASLSDLLDARKAYPQAQLLGGGTDLARTTADVVLMGDRLDHIPYLIALGRKTRRIVRQNLVWAIGYNALAIPFAALGFVTPWMAGLGMALSSLVVVTNALRLGAQDKENSPSATREPMPSAVAA